MVRPSTRPTTQKIISVGRYADVEVAPDVTGRAHWALLGLLRPASFQDLDEVTDSCLARMHRN